MSPTLAQLMKLADDYADAHSASEYQNDQGTRAAEVNGAFERGKASRAALVAALQSAVPALADTGPIIP